jgi:hypothetical protein
MQSYDTYKSPKQEVIKPPVVAPTNNFDKIKGSKLFQKFMMKEAAATTSQPKKVDVPKPI